MGKEIIYKKGDKLGPYNIEFIEEVEPYIRPNGKKDRKGKFICPHCQKEFIARFYDITKNNGRKGCPDCVKKMRRKEQTKHKIGQKYGPYNTILLAKEDNPRCHTFKGTYKCGHCGEIFIANHNALTKTNKYVCQECAKRGALTGDYVGPKKNFLVTKCFKEKYKGHFLYEFKCPFCGKLFTTVLDNINNGSRTSCGCMNPNYRQDLTGKQFGHWTVLCKTDQRDSHGEILWECLCSCGTKKLVRGSLLENGTSQSCGCSKESRGEKQIKQYFNNNKISYIRQQTFSNCKSPKNRVLKFDFYLPNYNCCIEYDGRQHFIAIDAWGGEESFQYRQECDNIKNQYCKDNDITLIRIPYTEYDNIETILDKELLQLTEAK